MKHLLFGIFLLALSACHTTSDIKPVDLIPQDQMIQVLVDIHVADAVVENRSGGPVNNLPMTNALYDRIYQNHKISAERYKSSYKYYESHPPLMNKMYEQVITELSKKEAQLAK